MIAEMYGGKIDNDDDFAQLKKMVKEVVGPAAYELDHKLVSVPETNEGLTVPSGTMLPDFMTWVTELPEREPPTYLGLPPNAEKLLLAEHGQVVIENLKRISDMLEDGLENGNSTAAD